jgi:hypothetical protein
MTIGTEMTSTGCRTGWWTEPPRSIAPSAADAVAFWSDIANAALACWASMMAPAVNGQRLAFATGSMVRDALEGERASETSWYRAPLGVQDCASGALGYVAGPFAMLLPAFTANPFWQPAASGFWPSSAALPKPMPLSLLQAAIDSNPWARLWAQSLPRDMLPPHLFGAGFATLQRALAPDAIAATAARPYPAYQSDSGHAVAQIIRTGAAQLVAILPILAFVVGLLIVAQQGGGRLVA